MKRIGVVGVVVLSYLLGQTRAVAATASFLPPAANDTSDRAVVLRVDPQASNFSTWQVSITSPGSVASPITVAYPTGFNYLIRTTADSGAPLIPNTRYTLQEQLAPAIQPGQFTFWTRPTVPGQAPGLLTLGCGFVQFAFKNSADPARANPAGTAYRVDLYYSSFCGPDVHACASNEYDYSLFKSTTVYAKSGLTDETLTATLTGLDATTIYNGWVTAVSGSGNAALDTISATEIQQSFAIDPVNSGMCSQPTLFLNSIDVNPKNQILLVGQMLPYTAAGFDQNGNPFPLNGVTWSITDSHGNVIPNAIDANGVFTAPNTIGGYFVIAKSLGAHGWVTGFTPVSVVNTITIPVLPPLVLDSVSATPSIVVGTQSQLLAVAHGGSAPLSYIWTAPAHSALNDPTLANPIATFTQTGIYTFPVTVRDTLGAMVTGSTQVIVNATATSLSVQPSTASVPVQGTQLFTATLLDQFGQPMNAPLVWMVSGGGSFTDPANGLFTAGSIAGGPFTVTVHAGALSATAHVIVTSTTVTPPLPPQQPPQQPQPPQPPVQTPNDGTGSGLTRVYPRAISPNGDGINDFVFFQLNNPDQKPVRGSIFDIQAARVAELQVGKIPGSTLIWDGKDTNGRTVPGGIYMYQVEVGDSRFNGTVTVVK